MPGNPNPSPSTRFQLGNSGLPGRPKGSVSLTTLIKEALVRADLHGKPTPDGRTNAEWFVDQMLVLAMRGNASYMKEVIDRNDGKTPDPVETPPVTMETLAAMEEADAKCDGEGQATPEQVSERPEQVQ